MKNFSALLFNYRSYTPIPFFIVMIFFANSTPLSLVIGFGMALLGEFFRFWGVSYAGSETRTTGSVGGTYLVISGAFGHLRNPLYLGNILLYMGVGVMSNALFPYLQIGAFFFFYMQYYFIINEEEKYLRDTFKEHYENYYKAVPRLLPRFTAYKNDNVEQPTYQIKAAFKSERRTLQALSFVTIVLIILYIGF
ncbi:MAG: isoprenylcysteine carboxylmethyltransferase family protein [Bacteroidetes bacterium]|nr:isoprenylcysteine carboxylmethyltransferase family protein [Bacteroidota bacterium]